MLYLSPPSTQPVRDAMNRGRMGALTVPGQGNRIEQGWTWAADNGCFGSGYPGDAKWIRWLAAKPNKETCLFAVAPDVVCDARATLARSAPHLAAIRELGYRTAFVLQNGVTKALVPWDDTDVVFIGGDDPFKDSRECRLVVDEALSRGMTAHYGRANGLGRLITANSMGCATADGKTAVMFPATLEALLRWLEDNRVQQGVLW